MTAVSPGAITNALARIAAIELRVARIEAELAPFIGLDREPTQQESDRRPHGDPAPTRDDGTADVDRARPVSTAGSFGTFATSDRQRADAVEARLELLLEELRDIVTAAERVGHPGDVLRALRHVVQREMP